ncbi:hypothetical protein ACHAXA_003721 [Cyclostephanos tholiformis]|jgi:hypothetical protein|uniref:Methyltransferase-domain-containing protein n=1 Tax=Cyclostephanos tholiformis TaxID=382380 RepID=A0ABD3RZA4_9STRA
MAIHSQFVLDPSLNVPINPQLKCGEEWTAVNGTDDDDDDDDDHFRHPSPITFHVTLPAMRDDDRIVKLTFNTRDKSSGVLLPWEPRATSKPDDDDNDNVGDPYFFERGFYLEAKTGFQPWPGTRLMIEAFTCMKNERMDYWQMRLARNDLTILEVGAGVGIVGTCLAAVGGNVLVTDLSVLVEHGIMPNLRRNDRRRHHRARDGNDVAAPPEGGRLDDFFLDSRDRHRIEDGWAQAVVLDWFVPISEQIPRTTSSALDVIVACDCMWMRKLIDPLFSVISTLFRQSSNRPSFLFTYQRRNMTGVFIGMEELLERIERRGWIVECIAWRTIAVEGDGEQDLHLFEVMPAKSF